MCAFGGRGFEKSVTSRVKGEGVKPGYRKAGSLFRDLGILVKHKRNQLFDYIMTTEPAWLAGIPVL